MKTKKTGFLSTVAAGSGRFFRFFSGTDENFLTEISKTDNGHSKVVRTIAGAIILLTFIITWVSLGWALTTFELGWGMSIALALPVALLKMFFDIRVVVAVSDKLAWARLFLLIPLAVFMAVPAVLFAVDGHLERMETGDIAENVEERRSELLQERDKIEREVDTYSEKASIFERLASVEKDGQTLDEVGLSQEDLETVGVQRPPSGDPSCGPRCRRHLESASEYRGRLQRAEDRLSHLPSRSEIDEAAQLELAEAGAARTNLLTRFDQLWTEGRENPIVGLLALLFVFVYLAFDLFPAFERLLSAEAYIEALKWKKKQREDEKKRDYQDKKRQQEAAEQEQKLADWKGYHVRTRTLTAAAAVTEQLTEAFDTLANDDWVFQAIRRHVRQIVTESLGSAGSGKSDHESSTASRDAVGAAYERAKGNLFSEVADALNLDDILSTAGVSGDGSATPGQVPVPAEPEHEVKTEKTGEASPQRITDRRRLLPAPMNVEQADATTPPHGPQDNSNAEGRENLEIGSTSDGMRGAPPSSMTTWFGDGWTSSAS